MKILLISNQGIKKKMAGPAIRYLEVMKFLSKEFEVYLMAKEVDEEYQSNNILPLNTKNLIRIGKKVDVIISQPSRFLLMFLSVLLKKKIVIDLYDPTDIENLAQFKDINTFLGRLRVNYSQQKLRFALFIADYFVCATQKQKDYWLGYLNGLNRINIKNYLLDDKLEKLIGLLPFGLSSDNIQQSKRVIKGVIPNINNDDKVIIWAGGVWNWFDPITLIKAMKEVTESYSDIKLLFLGAPEPDAENKKMSVLYDSYQLAKRLDLYNKYVFFNSDWVDYSERHNYLLESDIGISLHHNNIETTFSFRTRILDYLWANLPIITSEHDFFAEYVSEQDIGKTVKCGDINDVKQAIITIATDEKLSKKYRNKIELVKQNFYWEENCKDLYNFCESPYFAADQRTRIIRILFGVRKFFSIFINLKFK